jgi:hypothetical protein
MSTYAIENGIYFENTIHAILAQTYKDILREKDIKSIYGNYNSHM